MLLGVRLASYCTGDGTWMPPGVRFASDWATLFLDLDKLSYETKT
jgi:hypothetical protein